MLPIKSPLVALFLGLAALDANAQGLSLPVANWGDMAYKGQTVWQTIPFANTAGCFLQSQGSRAAPIWSCQAVDPWKNPLQSTNTLLGNVTGSTAAPVPVTQSQMLDTIGYDTLRPPNWGSIQYKSGTTWQNLTPGPNGWILVTHGIGANPTWGDPALVIPMRELVNSARTYYVNPSATLTADCGPPGVATRNTVTCNPGSDSNSGLTPLVPLRTVQKAVDIISGTLMLNNAQVDVLVANGSVTEQVFLKPYVGTFLQQTTSPRIYGDFVTPTNVRMAGNGLASSTIFFAQAMPTTWRVGGFDWKPSCLCGSSIFMDWTSDIELFGANRFDTQSVPLYIRYQSTLEILSGTTIALAGTMDSFALSVYGGTILGQGTPAAIPVTGTLTIANAFASVGTPGSLLDLQALDFSTAIVTGFKFSSGGGSFGTSTNPNLYPGTIAGYWVGARAPVIASDTTYYFSDLGLSTNDCTTTATACDSPTTIYARLQQQYDVSSNVTITAQAYCATLPCTFTNVSLTIAGPLVGGGLFRVRGDPATPTNYVLHAASDIFSIGNGAQISVLGFTTESTAGSAINAYGAGTVVRVSGAMRFSTAAAGDIQSQWGARVELNASYTVLTSKPSHLSAVDGGLIQTQSTLTLTVSGSPAWSTAFAVAQRGGIVHLPSASVTIPVNTATGPRYVGTLNGGFDPGGGGLTFFPGDTVGSLAEASYYGSRLQGATATVVVKGSAGANCNLVYTEGLFVSTTCP